MSAKKGVGHWGRRLPNAPELTGASWYYNWGPRPTPGATAAFVPMIWGKNNLNDEDLAAAKATGSPIVLAFNEPDGHGQADLTVAEAVAAWPRLEATGLKLGSPGTTTGAKWLDEFMAQAKKRHLRVDVLCLHWYGDITKPDPVGDLKAYLQGYWDRYHLPIWLTEYSGADFDYHLRPTTVEEEARFAAASVTMLEALPFVERYAWFAPLVRRDDRHYSKVGLCRRNGGLTLVGRAYRDAR